MHQAVGTSRTDGILTRQVSDANEWSTVPRGTPMENFIRQHGDFVANELRGAQPMQANKRISDMIGAPQIENQPCSCMLHRLKAAHLVGTGLRNL